MTAPQLLKRASLRLLVRIADEDHGDGVRFHPAGRGRVAVDSGSFAVARETFRVPSEHALISVDHPDPAVWLVRLTEAGRSYLLEHETRRPRARKEG